MRNDKLSDGSDALSARVSSKTSWRRLDGKRKSRTRKFWKREHNRRVRRVGIDEMIDYMNENSLNNNEYRKNLNTLASNILIRENRIGRFSISRFLLTNTSHQIICKLFSTMIVVRAESAFVRDCVDYMAFSAIFPSISLDKNPPVYHIWVTEDASGELGFTVENRDDSWNNAGVSISYAKSKELRLPGDK